MSVSECEMADRKSAAVMESLMLVAPVTALEFLEEEYLLAGEGPILSVYSLQTLLINCTSLSVLQNQRIHGIHLDPWQQERGATAAAPKEEELFVSPWQQSGRVRSVVLAVFGGKAVRVVGLKETGCGGPSLEALGPVIELQDWVCDVRWLRARAPLLAVALAHNAVLLLEAGKGWSLALCSCQEGCLLYSALLLGQRWDDMVIVGGTVFNQLVIWRPGEVGEDGRDRIEGLQMEVGRTAQVEKRLSGHSGVIFSLAYLPKHGWLASASDDRSVRLWGVGALGGVAGCGVPAPPCLRVLYGHQARVFSVRLSPGRVFSAGEDGACLQWGWDSGRVERSLKGHIAGGVRALALSGGGRAVEVACDWGGRRRDQALEGMQVHLRAGRGKVHSVLWAGQDGVRAYLLASGTAGQVFRWLLEGALYSCGRDGCVRELRVGAGDRLEVLRVERACRGMEWVERVLILDPEEGGEEQGTGEGCQMVVLGFQSVFFVVWDPVRRERLLSVPCGGGHRSWSYCPPSGPHRAGGALVFVKQGAVLATQVPQDPQGAVSWGLKVGLHGRGMGCVCRLGWVGPAGQGERWEILAAGGEDTSLSVLALQPLSGALRVLSVITDHISSVRALAVGLRGKMRIDGQKHGCSQTDGHTVTSLSSLLISAGGRAQLQCYRLLVGWGSQLSSPFCQVIQVASHRLDEQWERRRNRHKIVKMDPETRYMSLAVLHDGPEWILLAVGCSDGAVRVFSVSEVDGSFQLLWESFYHQRCVLSVAPCCLKDPQSNRKLFMFSGATDGRVAVWDMSTITAWRASPTAAPTWNGTCSPCLTFTVHQSGVNSLAVWEGHGDGQTGWMTVASGGDDGQLSVVNIRVQFHQQLVEGSTMCVELQSQSTVLLAHAAPLTALRHLGPSLLVSASPDQRVCLWSLCSSAPHHHSPGPHQQGPASASMAPPHISRTPPLTSMALPYTSRACSSHTWPTQRAWRCGLGLGVKAEPG
ncbi:hypothetical protein AAFF_G00207870 [Aldrovandia affinis]|uniref:tRNA (34-2'-O)-methyltransferase regulator WDR6 n=1 Tax=Aldrovandia affinis TaxID=143900 RepID=A0AAD7RHA9_9TELE|nr:hypothetical protein AAFF_G00207870 [Aldrovandia affinis]